MLIMPFFSKTNSYKYTRIKWSYEEGSIVIVKRKWRIRGRNTLKKESDYDYYLHRRCHHRTALYIDTDRFSGPSLRSLRKSYRHNLLETKILGYKSSITGTFCNKTRGEQSGAFCTSKWINMNGPDLLDSIVKFKKRCKSWKVALNVLVYLL